MLKGFNVTYDIVAEESSREGDYAESGFLGQDLSLREAIELAAEDQEGELESINANEYPVSGSVRWFTWSRRPDNYRTFDSADVKNTALHIPEYVSPSSRKRIARLIGCYGAK